MLPLDPLALNLSGQILVEASAGTGKTYAIALLFLRLLLELELDLRVGEILVVTFTNAAAEELRSRIRQRIRDALDLLEGRGGEADPLLQELLAKHEGRDAASRLNDALTCMDEAAIYTIHGFCQRMLQEHAFESGSPFEMDLLESEHVLRSRIMEDFWRQRLCPLPPSHAAWAASLWQSPSDLLGKLGGHLGRAELDCIPKVDQQDLDRWTAELDLLFVQVRMQWQKCRTEAEELLRTSPRLLRDKSRSYGQNRLDAALGAMDRMAALEDAPWLLDEHLKLLTAGCICASLNKKKGDPPEHPFFNLFEQFVETHRRTSSFRRIKVLLEARDYLASELARRKKEAGQLSFDDLLTKLDAGLQSPTGRLAQCIGRRFPVIMVDEFQDTDPLQYRIFKTIHAVATQDRDMRNMAGLLLIGDPKQAIYSFRGADIFTYIQARQDTPEPNRLTMTVNHRSSRSMVKAVSRLFACDAPFFLPKSEIDFPAVEGKGRLQAARPFLVDGLAPAPMTCLLLAEEEEEKPLAKATAEEQAARFCAHEIASLLAAGGAGRARIGERELSAGDVAVLVRTHAEAEQMRQKLNALGIASVCGGQDSVYSSREAKQLLLFMTSLGNLSDSGMLRTVLAGDLFGWTAEHLEQLLVDGQEWDRAWAAMDRCRQLWQQQGFLPMFQRLLAEQQTVGRLSATPSGERMLTNYLHLAELLQEAGRHLPSTDALRRWLDSQIHSPEEQSESQQLRLESDENLVKIVTIHKAKGMEYPLVFLPFLWNGRPCADDEPLLFHRTGRPDRLCVDLGSGSSEHLRLAEQERLSEDLRLLYVAATRAVHCCCFCWGWISKMEHSALCYLLHGFGALSPARIAEDLQRLADVLEVKPHPGEFFRPSLHGASRTPLSGPAVFRGRIDASWQTASYSSLVARKGEGAELPGRDEGYAEAREPAAPSSDAFGFPKGATAGTCLHDILERISFGHPRGHEQVVAEALKRAGIDASWQTVACSWVQDVLKTPLPGRDGLFSLSCLKEDEQVKEMSFDFPLAGLRTEQLDRLLSAHGHAPLLGSGETLHGMMTGFVDLVFCRQGWYYIADYKSNHLGCQAADYEPKKLEAAMAEHRYDLQYLIYAVALHRFLAGRIRGYSYESRFGGVFYLFLRGMHPDRPGAGVFLARPSFALVDGLDKCFGRPAGSRQAEFAGKS